MNIGVIFAGGVGNRMHSKDKPKQFLNVYGKPIIIYTLEHFENAPEIDGVVIACVEEWIGHLKELIEKYGLKKVKKIVAGGRTGQLSIYNGLKAAKEIAGDEPSVVLIHDGVRPLISSELLRDNIKCVHEHGSCITSGIVKETIVVVGDDMKVKILPDREHSRVAKAPQSFWLDDILAVHNDAASKGEVNYIDSCTIMKEYGYELYMIDGPYENIKITTPDDFFTMKAIVDAKENAQIYGF